MNRKFLLALWGSLFVLCALLGLIPKPEGALRVCLTVVSLVFFVPGFLLLRAGSRSTVQLVRNLSALSLVLTLVCLIANMACVLASEAVGNLLYIILTVVSAPMVCSGFWALSLFLWACLLICAWQKTRRK